MAEDDRFSLASARRAAERDELADWVSAFLASPGSDNEALAAALALNETTYLGPVEVELDRLVPLAGPDDDAVLVPIDEEEWESDIDAMTSRVDDGWEPPPLLVSHHDGNLYLEDGNHRHESLLRSGETTAWAIVMFPNADERRAFFSEVTSGAASNGSAGEISARSEPSA